HRSAHLEGVRAALVPRLASPPRLLPGPADGPRLGLRVGSRHGHGDRPRAAAAREDRSRSEPAAPPAHRLGRRLPPRSMIQLALVVAAGSLVSGLVLAYLLRRAPTVGIQLAGLALIAVCVPLAAVLLSGWVMFHMGADVKILAVAAGAATAAVVAGLLLGRALAASLRRVGSASHSLAAGDLSARAPVEGAREIAELAESFNAMAAGVEQLFDARRELVAWASHDLRAPIASLQAMLE